MDWEDLKYFIELARCGTLSGAARSLKVNHATVARRLTRLETRLAVTLFDRRAEGYVLTAAGEAVLAEALAMKEAAETIQRRCHGTAALSGLVRLTATRTLSDLWLVRQLDGLHRRYPALDLEIIAESRNMSLARREVDLALRLARPIDGDIIARRIGNLGYGLYATAEQRDRLLRGDDVPFVGFDDESTPEAAWLQHYARGRRFAFRSNSPLSQMMATQAGFGIAALPCFLATGAVGLVPIEVGEAPPTREVWLLIRRNLATVPRVRAVIDYLIEIFERDRAFLLGPEDSGGDQDARAAGLGTTMAK
jgi:DNA-binding transcriptional LysR family regulator